MQVEWKVVYNFVFKSDGLFRFFLISILLILPFAFSCSDDEEAKNQFSNSSTIQGLWRISPSDEIQSLDFDTSPGIVVLKLESNDSIFKTKEDFVLLDDGKGIRIQRKNESMPTGYFLYSDKKGNSWTGLWNDELVRLIRTEKD